MKSLKLILLVLIIGCGNSEELPQSKVMLKSLEVGQIQTSNLYTTNQWYTSGPYSVAVVEGTTGNGWGYIVVGNKDHAVNVVPEDGVAYEQGEKFGDGSDLGDGNFVVYSELNFYETPSYFMATVVNDTITADTVWVKTFEITGFNKYNAADGDCNAIKTLFYYSQEVNESAILSTCLN